MDSALLWAAVVSGVLGLLYGLSVLLSHHRELEKLAPAEPAGKSLPMLPFSLAAGCVVAFVLIGLGLLRAGVFSRGQGLVAGMCVGAPSAAALGVLLHLLHRAAHFRRRSADERLAPGRATALARLSLGTATALLGMAALSCALAQLLCKGDLLTGMIGYALGAVAVLGVSCLLDATMGEGADGPREAYVVIATLVALGAIFGHLHFTSATAAAWRMLPAAMVGVAGVAAALCGPLLDLRSIASRAFGTRLLCAAVPGGVILLLAKILSAKSLDEPHLMVVILTGVAAAVAMLLASMTAPEERPADGVAAMQAMGLCALVVLLLCALTMRLMAGYGVGLALTLMGAMLTFALVAGDEERARLPLAGPMALAVGMGLCFLLYRLFIERYPTVQYVELGVHYNFVALVGGAVLPALVATYQARTALLCGGDDARPAWPAMVRTLLLGAALVVLPVALLALWSTKAVIGLIVGVLVGLVYLGMLPPETSRSEWCRGGVLIALIGLGLLCVQLTGHFSEWASLAREVRIRVAIWLAAAAVVWFIVDAVLLARHSKEAATCTSDA